jgi:hypothetical protein
MKHKHAEVIKAWADGAEIECLDPYADKWVTPQMFVFSGELEFRVKPTPKPDVVDFMCVTHGQYMRRTSGFNASPNLKLTYDGETGKLKATEVIE